MKGTNRRTHLLQFAILSCFLGFLVTMSVTSVGTQQRTMSETLTTMTNGIRWVDYYPTWFFQGLTLLTAITLVCWTVAAGHAFEKPYPNLNQLASWKTSLISILLLNILFLGTSHVISYPPFPYHHAYNMALTDLGVDFGLDIQQFYDLASALLIAMVVISASLRYRGLGLAGGVLKVLQIVSLIILPLGLEVFAFDNIEWNLHVAQFQVAYGIAPWFTNADLFLTLLLLFVSVTILRRVLPNLRLVWGQTKRNDVHQ